MPRVTLDDPDDTLSLLRDSVAQFAAQHDGVRSLRDKRERAGSLTSIAEMFAIAPPQPRAVGE